MFRVRQVRSCPRIVIAIVATAVVAAVIPAAVNGLWYPGDDSVATEWGPLVHFVVGSAVRYVVMNSWELVSVVA
ncbi:hypothetical protein [Haloferax mediterranei]|nr:hypothetical protein [Haloferax mediterranei]